MAYRTAIQDTTIYAAYIRDERNSPEAARRWLDGLSESIKGLAEAPNHLSVIPEADELGLPYRSFVYHSHRVVYLIDDTSLLVTVHRVYHSARQSLTENGLHKYR